MRVGVVCESLEYIVSKKNKFHTWIVLSYQRFPALFFKPFPCKSCLPIKFLSICLISSASMEASLGNLSLALSRQSTNNDFSIILRTHAYCRLSITFYMSKKEVENSSCVRLREEYIFAHSVLSNAVRIPK